MAKTFRFVTLAALLAFGCDGSSPGGSDAGPPAEDASMAATDAGPTETDAGVPGDTWTTWAMGFFATYCVECHDTSPKDFRQLADVRANASEIACGVSPVVEDGCGSFPPPAQFPIGTGPHPTDAERMRLVAWIQSGAPE